MTTAYLTRYRNGEYLQYMKDVLVLVNLQDVALLELTEQRDTLNSLTNQIDEAFLQSLGSALTQEIILLDERRDKAFIGIKTLLSGYTYHYDTTQQDHAKNILLSIDIYGKDITRKSYQEETAIINSLINDLETQPELIAAINAINISDWVNELKTSNQAFGSKYIERVGETAANPITNITELRATTSTAYRTLISHIQAHDVLGNNPSYATLLEEIDVLTKQYNLVLDNRSNSSPNGATPATDGESNSQNNQPL